MKLKIIESVEINKTVNIDNKHTSLCASKLKLAELSLLKSLNEMAEQKIKLKNERLFVVSRG